MLLENAANDSTKESVQIHTQVINSTSLSEMLVSILQDNVKEDSAFSDIPKFMHMTRHVYRGQLHFPKGHNTKSFFNTDLVYNTFNHWPARCFGKCKSVHADISEGQMNHYRSICYKGNDEKCQVSTLAEQQAS